MEVTASVPLTEYNSTVETPIPEPSWIEMIINLVTSWI